MSLRPSTPYGKVAALISLTGDGRSIVAIGAAHGGAHANFRWTIWTGTAAGVVDRPQTFETFGGQEAGGLLAVAQDREGPLIVGTWQGAYGLDGAIWRPRANAGCGSRPRSRWPTRSTGRWRRGPPPPSRTVRWRSAGR